MNNNSIHDLGRRQFIRKSSTVMAGLSVVPSYVVSGLGYKAPSDKLNIAVIGIGGKGKSLVTQAANENLVALCDVDWNVTVEEVFNTYKQAKRYKDYRLMLDRQKEIDAVMIATPDHTHAVISMEAIKQIGRASCRE